MRVMRLGLLVLGLASLVGAARGLTQQQAPVTRAELVRLDVIVTDADGQPVRDLTREDFAVFEDKKPQRLTSFQFVERRLRADASPAQPGTATQRADAPPPVEAAPGPGRHVVIVIDDLHIAPGNLDFVKGALRRFVEDFVGPDDSVALLTTSAPAGTQQLTQDKARIQQQITMLNLTQPAVPPAPRTEMTPGQAELILRGDRNARRLAGQRLLAEPGNIYENAINPRAATEAGQSAIAGASGGNMASREQLEAVAERDAERQARAVLNDALRYSVATLYAIEDVLRSLSPLPGRKLCLLVSDGFLVGAGTSEERTRELRGIVDAATRAGAVVYAVDSRGLQGSVDGAGVAGAVVSPGLQSSVDRQSIQLTRLTLETLAADTGGFLVSGTNAFDAGLKRVLAENDSYYLMAYEPGNTKRDGKFRRIEVRLARHADYSVRSRTGYFAPDDSKPSGSAVRRASLRPEPRGIVESEARAIIDAARSEGGLPLRFAASYVDLPTVGSLAIVRAHVDVATLADEGGGAGPLAVDLLGGVYDAEGNTVGPAFGHHAEVTAEELAQARREGVRFEQRLQLPPGRYEIRMAARDASRTWLGGASEWVEIPDLGDGALALSSIFLSSGTPQPPGAAGEAAGAELHDVQARRRFGTKDNLFFQVYIYNLREQGGGTDAVLQAQLRQGETLMAASQPQPIGYQRKDGTLLPHTNGMPLEGLPKGRYELRVVVMDKTANATATRDVDFTIE